MSKIVWDETGKRFWETGVKNGVLYPQKADGTYDKGVAWNGLISVSNNPDGAEPNELWADNMKYAVLRSAETLNLSIEAYTYPEEFEPCDGMAHIETAPGLQIGQQPRQSFGLCYRTEVGNDTSSTPKYYKLHLVYGCSATPSDKDYETINDNPDAITFNWDIDTLPVDVPDLEPSAELIIDSRTADAEKLAAREGYLYGKNADNTASPAVEASEPMLPTPTQVIKILTDGTL